MSHFNPEFGFNDLAYHVESILKIIEATAKRGSPLDPFINVNDLDLREGLRETPARVAKAYETWFGGYFVDPVQILKTFEDGGENYDQMVVRKGIPLYSHCEHHMAAIFGEVTVAYIPNGKVVGLSKMDRLVEVFGRRLQVQERLTQQIAHCMNDNLQPRGVAVYVKARHMCVESRGVCNQNSETITQCLLGAFRDEPETRAEFMALARS